MSLYGYKPKWKPALWVGDAPKAKSKRSRENSTFSRRSAAFLRRARAAKLPCPVASAGLVEPGPLTDTHHRFGRAGALLLWEPGWVAVSRAGHEWVERNPDRARSLGLVCDIGFWGQQPDRLPAQLKKMNKKLDAIQQRALSLTQR